MGQDSKLEEALVGSKLDSVLQEYNEMLTRTLDDQRRFFEDRMAAMQQQVLVSCGCARASSCNNKLPCTSGHFICCFRALLSGVSTSQICLVRACLMCRGDGAAHAAWSQGPCSQSTAENMQVTYVRMVCVWHACGMYVV